MLRVHTVIRRMVLTGLAVMFAMASAEAAPVWEHDGVGLTIPHQTITFDELGLAALSLVDTQYAGLGASFSPTMLQINTDLPLAAIDGAFLANVGSVNNGPVFDPFSILFAQPVMGAGLSIITNPPPGGPGVPGVDFTTFKLFLGATQVGGAANAFIIDDPAFRFISVTNVVFDRIEIDAQSTGAAFIDNLQFAVATVPEPVSFLLLGTGALGLAARARRRARRLPEA